MIVSPLHSVFAITDCVNNMQNASIKQIVVKLQVHLQNPIVLVFIAG